MSACKQPVIRKAEVQMCGASLLSDGVCPNRENHHKSVTSDTVFSMFGNLGSMPMPEPSARTRQSAQGMYETYVAFVAAGFNDEQAMQMVCTMLGTTIMGLIARGEGDS